jgi:hypothetical protein
MAEEPDDLVKLVGCGNNAEAAFIRSLLEANGIFAYVQGEHHRSMLGMIGAYIDLRVLVRARDLDAARKLLANAEEDLEAAEVDGEAEARPPEEVEASEALVPEAGRPRRSFIVAIALAALPGFGCAHFYARRARRAAAFAAAELAGLIYLVAGHPIGIALVGLAVVLDAAGAAATLARQP